MCDSITAALGYCCLHDSLRDRQNAAKENLPVPHDKNKTKQNPAELPGVQRSAKHKFRAIHLATSINECKFLCERAIMSHYYDTTYWYTNYCPLQSAKVHFTSPQRHFLHILSLLSVHLQCEDLLIDFFSTNDQKLHRAPLKSNQPKLRKINYS